jgi:hypothetical protein
MPSLGLSLGLDSSSSQLLTTALAGIAVSTTNSFTWNGYTWNKEVIVDNLHNLRFKRSDYIEPAMDDIGVITNNFIFYCNRSYNPVPVFHNKWVLGQLIYNFLNDEDNYGYYVQTNDSINSFYYLTGLTYSPAGVSVSTLPTSFNSLSITNVS